MKKPRRIHASVFEEAFAEGLRLFWAIGLERCRVAVTEDLTGDNTNLDIGIDEHLGVGSLEIVLKAYSFHATLRFRMGEETFSLRLDCLA